MSGSGPRRSSRRQRAAGGGGEEEEEGGGIVAGNNRRNLRSSASTKRAFLSPPQTTPRPNYPAKRRRHHLGDEGEGHDDEVTSLPRPLLSRLPRELLHMVLSRMNVQDVVRGIGRTDKFFHEVHSVCV